MAQVGCTLFSRYSTRVLVFVGFWISLVMVLYFKPGMTPYVIKVNGTFLFLIVQLTNCRDTTILFTSKKYRTIIGDEAVVYFNVTVVNMYDIYWQECTTHCTRHDYNGATLHSANFWSHFSIYFNKWPTSGMKNRSLEPPIGIFSWKKFGGCMQTLFEGKLQKCSESYI